MDEFNVDLHKNVFLSPDEIFQNLEKDIQYIPSNEFLVRVMGKTFSPFRSIAAYGDPYVSYTYSGLTVRCKPWTPLLSYLKRHVERATGYEYNFVLINRYQNGFSHIGYHRDDEKDLDTSYPICALSFGETRTLIFKRSGYANRIYELESNTLLVMKPPTNLYWSHGIPREKKRTGVRVSLTFRKIRKF